MFSERFAFAMPGAPPISVRRGDNVACIAAEPSALADRTDRGDVLTQNGARTV